MAYRIAQSPKYPRVETDVPLNKVIQGQKASDLEERFARALDKIGKPYQFQYIIAAFDGAPIANLQGEVHLDFLVLDDIPRPVQVADTEFIHRSSEQINEDMQKDIRTNSFLSQYGAAPVMWVTQDDLSTQEMADRWVRENLTGNMMAQETGMAPITPVDASGAEMQGTIQAPPEPRPIAYPMEEVEEDIMLASEVVARLEQLEKELADAKAKNEQQDALLAGIFNKGSGGTIIRLADVTADLGDVRAGRFLALSDGIEPTIDGTGAFMSADGETFSGTKYHVGGVNAGALQAGFSATDGKFVAGGGEVTIDSAGVNIEIPTLYSSTNSYKFVNSSGVAEVEIYGYDSGTQVISGYRLLGLAARDVIGNLSIDIATKTTYPALLTLNTSSGPSNLTGSYIWIKSDSDDANNTWVQISATNGGTSKTIHLTNEGLSFGNYVSGVGGHVDEFSIDGTMAGNSDTALPTEKAVVTYVAATSAPLAKGVTNGDSHDHVGGDGAAIALGTAVSGTLPLANGGTGQALSDPGADRGMFWDESESKVDWLTFGSGLSLTGTTLTATGAGLTNSNITPTTANVAAAVNYRYFADISGLTADRNFVLPAPAVGDVIELIVTVGDAAYELIVIGDTGITINGGSAATEWSRLFISGEKITLVANTTSNWQVQNDGRIPSVCRIQNTSVQAIANTTATYLTLDETVTDVGNIGDTANNRIIVRRANNYAASGGLRYDNISAASARSSAWILVNAASIGARFELYAAANGYPAITPSTANYPCAAGDIFTFQTYQNSGASQNTLASQDYPHLCVTEIL